MLYVVRHGEAKSAQEDPERGLSERGRTDIERIAAWAARTKIRVDRIRHSGKARAAQTAAVFARALGVTDCDSSDGLDPDDGVAPLVRSLDGEARPVMLVGHLPFVSRLVSHLTRSDDGSELVVFRPGTLVGLSREEPGWVVTLVVSPDSIPG